MLTLKDKVKSKELEAFQMSEKVQMTREELCESDRF